MPVENGKLIQHQCEYPPMSNYRARDRPAVLFCHDQACGDGGPEGGVLADAAHSQKTNVGQPCRADGKPAAGRPDWGQAAHPSLVPEPPYELSGCLRPPSIFAPTEELVADRDSLVGLAGSGSLISGPLTVDVCHRHVISSATFGTWKAKFGGFGETSMAVKGQGGHDPNQRRLILDGASRAAGFRPR